MIKKDEHFQLLRKKNIKKWAFTQKVIVSILLSFPLKCPLFCILSFKTPKRMGSHPIPIHLFMARFAPSPRNLYMTYISNTTSCTIHWWRSFTTTLGSGISTVKTCAVRLRRRKYISLATVLRRDLYKYKSYKPWIYKIYR